MSGKHAVKKALPRGAGFTPREVAALDAASSQSQSGTPGVILDAFLGEPVTIGSITIPVTMLGHVLLLQKIGSPLATPTGEPPSNEQITEALFVLNHPPATVLAAWREGQKTPGRDAWLDQVVIFGNTIPVAQLPAIGAALGAALAHAESTVVGATTEPAKPDGAKKNGVATPPAPPPPPANPTG